MEISLKTIKIRMLEENDSQNILVILKESDLPYLDLDFGKHFFSWLKMGM